MRKHGQKNASSIPPDWHTEETDRLIKGWLRDRELRGYGRDPEFMAWARKMAETAKDTLVDLLRKYRIQPFDILEMLALYKSEEWFYTHLIIRKKLRSAALRETDARVLEQAASILEQWRNYLIDHTRTFAWNQYPEINHVYAVAKALRALGPSKKHRHTEVRLRCCAQQLAELIENHTPGRKPLYGHIGTLIKAAFPKDWGAAGSLREAAKQLVKGWDYRIRQIDARDYPIWIVDNRLTVIHINQAAGRLLGVAPWETAGKNVDFILKALLAKTPKGSGFPAAKFRREYEKILKHRGFDWKTVLTLEREITNDFYQREKQIVTYDFLAQREIRSLASPGTATYLTEKEPMKATEDNAALKL